MSHIALIWASENPESLAFRLFIRLREGGFEVVPINPNYQMIAGVPCFASLSELKTLPEAVIFMVNPKLTLQVLEEVVKLKIKKVWFQPWTFDDGVLKFCAKAGLEVEHEKCLLVSPLQTLEEFAKKELS